MKISILIKRAIDVFMLSLFVYLMNYRTFGSLVIHAWAGITLFALFIVHNILNRKYWRTLAKGKYKGQRKVLAITNIALFIFMIAMAVSSCMMSRAVFYNSPFSMNWIGMEVHKFSTAWGFMIMIVHLSLHLQVALGLIERWLFKKSKILKVVYVVCSAIIVAAGIFAFYHSGLWRAMFFIEGQRRIYNSCVAIAEYVFMLLGAAVVARVNCKRLAVSG